MYFSLIVLHNHCFLNQIKFSFFQLLFFQRVGSSEYFEVTQICLNIDFVHCLWENQRN